MKTEKIKTALRDMHKAKRGKELEAYRNSLPITRTELLALEERVKRLELPVESSESQDELWREVEMLFNTYSNATTEMRTRFTLTRKP